MTAATLSFRVAVQRVDKVFVYTLSDDEKRTSAIVFDLFGQKRQLRRRRTNGKDAVKRTHKVFA